MATKEYLVKSMLMSILTAGIVSSLTSCRDDLDLPVNGENGSVDVEEWVEPVSFKAICNKPIVYMTQSGNIPFSLYHQIAKASSSSPDNLNKDGSVTMRFEVMPIYVQSVNGDDAGDYYAVRSTVAEA